MLTASILGDEIMASLYYSIFPMYVFLNFSVYSTIFVIVIFKNYLKMLFLEFFLESKNL